MKVVRIIIPAFALLGLLQLTGCSISDAGKKSDVMSDEAWLRELRERDTALGELMKTISLIEASLEEIKLREGLLELPGNDEFAPSKREKMLNDLQLINLLLADNRSKLESVEKRLTTSGISSEALRHQLNQLNHVLVTRERSKDSLWTSMKIKDAEIARMNMQIQDLGNTIMAHEEVIVSQDKALNEAFYTVGTKKELKQNGVLKEGIAFPGSSPKMNEKLNISYFTKIDVRQVRSIPVHSKKAKLISFHSDGSFEWRKEKNQVEALEIIDPEKFWKTSKFLIIELN